MSPDLDSALILNVDDDSASLYTKSRFLRRVGYRVLEAQTGKDALEQVVRERPDLVILDVHLPDLSGLEVCAKIKNEPGLVGTLVLQTSASFIDSPDRVAALDIGADMYLVEPLEPEEFIAVVRALLRLRAAERKAAASDRRFHVLARGAPVGIFHADIYGSCTYVNEMWCRITGLDGESGLGQSWRRAMHPADVDRVTAAFAQAVRDKAPFNAEYRFVRSSQQVSWVWGQALPELSDSGEVVGYIGSVTDITERKRIEEKLREADRSKDEFLAMLSHELRNPLAPLRSTLELLRKKQQLGSAGRELDIMDRQLRQLTRLTDDLFDIARFSQKRIPLKKERADLREIVDAAVETSRPAFEAATHSLSTQLSDVMVPVHGDPVRLTQVIANLLNNAAKFTPTGGCIELHVERHASHGVVRVIDNGIGMPGDALHSIFELFTQINAAPMSAQGGLGIGLALSRRIVDMHDGTLTAHSAGPGQGSEFVLRLPLLAEGEHVGAELHAHQRGLEAPARRVLLVDDNEDASASLALLLEMEGHEVQIASDGIIAVEMAAQWRPQIILLDLGLPRMTGIEVARHVRGQEWGRKLLLIALTGWGQDADRQRTQEAGFDHHLVKPIAVEDLKALLK